MVLWADRDQDGRQEIARLIAGSWRALEGVWEHQPQAT